MTIVPLLLRSHFTVACCILPLIATISPAQPVTNPPPLQPQPTSPVPLPDFSQPRESYRQMFEEMRLRSERLNELELELYRRQWPAGAESQRPLLPPPTPAMNAPTAYLELASLPPALQPQLRESVAETFYLPLDHLAVQDELPKKQSRAIADYLSRRRDLVTRLRATRTSAASSDGAGESQLAELHALEAEAESIRHQLTARSASQTGAASLQQILTNPPKNAPAGLIDAVRATEAACYHDGLSSKQREALLELAIEVRTPDGQTKPLSRGAKPIFFLPWTARIDTPSGLPPAVQEDLDAFMAAKRKVKDELFAVVKAVARKSARIRSAAYRDLADRQESQWVALETQAEALRRFFQTAGYPPRPPAVPASEELTERVARALLTKTALQRELTEFVQSLRQLLPRDKIEIIRQGEALAVSRGSGSDPSSLSAADEEKIQSAITKTNTEFAKKYAPLARELNAVRVELEFIVSQLPDGEKIGADALANNLLQAWLARQTWPRYADYRTAVLTPGLTPAERSSTLR